MKVYGLRFGVGKSAFEALFAACFGILLMFFERCGKTLFVHLDAFFRGEFLCDLHGEAERVVKMERRFAVDGVAVKVRDDLFEFLQAADQRFGELQFFFIEFGNNLFAVFRKFAPDLTRISVPDRASAKSVL